MGKTGKSVARSYMSALDLLIPVEASVSGLIANPGETAPEGRRKIIKDRYDTAMNYLKSYETDEPGPDPPKSKLKRYVEKQEVWAKAVETYAIAQERQQGDCTAPGWYHSLSLHGQAFSQINSNQAPTASNSNKRRSCSGCKPIPAM